MTDLPVEPEGEDEDDHEPEQGESTDSSRPAFGETNMTDPGGEVR